MNIFEILFYQPIYNLIIVLYRILGGELGLAIIAVGIISRAVLIPLALKQAKLAETGREFSDKAKEIKKRVKDKEKQQQELLKLQQEYLPAQLGGCLPLILQFIIFINIYSVLRNIIEKGAESFNQVAYSFVPKFTEGYSIDNDFFRVFDLQKSPSQVEGVVNLIPYIVLIILVGLTQYYSFKVIASLRKAKPDKDKDDKSKKKKEGEAEDFNEIMQRSTQQATALMPLLLMFISFSLPSGLSIYLITTSTFVILQQLIFSKYKTLKQENEDKIRK